MNLQEGRVQVVSLSFIFILSKKKVDKIMFLLRKNYEITQLEKTLKVISFKLAFHF